MPLPKKNLKNLDWKRKIRFQVEPSHFAKYAKMTSLSDIVKTFENMDAMELWKDPEGNFHWATCATLNDEEIKKGLRVVLTFNQVVAIPEVKAEFNAWKKTKAEEPPKKLCGFRTPHCVLESLDKDKKPRAPATPKKSKEEKDFDDAKEVAMSAGKKKKPAAATSAPSAVLSKQTAAALASMDIDDSLVVDQGAPLTFEPLAAPLCAELDVSKEYVAHLQVLHLMSIFEDQDNQEESLIERINHFVTSYRQSDAGTTKKTLAKWSKTTDPDFKNLLAGFGLSVLAAYKNKVVTPFVNTANDKLKEVVKLYQELQDKIKANQVFVNQLKADKERLAADLQSLLAKNRVLETELADKNAEIASLFKQLEERKKQDEKDEKKQREEEIVATVNDPAQTVISSSGGFRKRDEPSPIKKKVANSAAAAAALADSDDEDDEVMETGKLPVKPAQKSKLSVSSDDEDDAFSKPAAGKKRTFADSEDGEESKPVPKKSAAQKVKAPVSLVDSDDEGDVFSKSASSILSAKSAAAIAKIGKSMNFDDSDDEQESKPVAKPAGGAAKPKPNASKFLLGDDDD